MNVKIISKTKILLFFSKKHLTFKSVCAIIKIQSRKTEKRKEVLKMTIEKFALYIGLNDKVDKVQKINTVEAYKMVQNVALQMFDGCTISEADGIYKHEDGGFAVEKTLRVELLFTNLQTVKQFAEQIKIILNQESIAMQREVLESELI